MERVRRYVRHLQLAHPAEDAIINKFQLKTMKLDGPHPVVYLYSDGTGVLRFRNVIYGAGEDTPAELATKCEELVVFEFSDDEN